MSGTEPTYGEKLLRRLVEKLPAKDFYGYAEPRIDSSIGESRYPDFVIVWRERGVICIEVKDWKKIVDGNGREVIVETGGKTRYFGNPYETARNYVNRLMKKLEERRELLRKFRGAGEKLAFPVEPVVVLTHQDRFDLSRLAGKGIFPENAVLGSEDLSSVDAFISALARVRWHFLPADPLSEVQIEAIKRILGIIEVRTPRGVKHGSLTEEQEDIIWEPLPYRENGISTTLVRGVVGSGKTIVIIKKVQLLTELRPDLKILITTFNLDLASDLKRRISQANAQVMALDEVVENILQDEYPRQFEYRGKLGPRPNTEFCKEHDSLFTHLPPDFVPLEFSRRKDLNLDSERQYLVDLSNRGGDLAEEDIAELLAAYELYREEQEKQGWIDYEDTRKMALGRIHGHRYHRYFDVIFVDEGQDFSPTSFALLRSMIAPGGFLFVCDDPMQSLWREFDLKDKGLQSARIKLLKLPLRTTREIAEAAQSLFELVPAISADDSYNIYPAQTERLERGHKPRLLAFSAREQEQRYIQKRIQEHLTESPDASLGVFTPNFYREWDALFAGMGVYYAHFNRIKGLEFDTAYLARLDDMFQSKWNAYNIMKRWYYRKLFVAMTRARRKLFISYVGELPPFMEPLKLYCDYQEDPD